MPKAVPKNPNEEQERPQDAPRADAIASRAFVSRGVGLGLRPYPSRTKTRAQFGIRNNSTSSRSKRKAMRNRVRGAGTHLPHYFGNKHIL